MGYSKTLELGYSFVLSDVLLGANDAVKGGLVIADTKLKSIRIIHEIYPFSSFRFWCGAGSGAGSTYFHIRLNGVVASAEMGPYVGALADRGPLDVTFTTLKVHDELELWGRNTQNNGSVNNFRIYGNGGPFYNSLV